MNQIELVQKLDAFFDVSEYDESAFWETVIPAEAMSVYTRFAEAEFIRGTWNGLMLNNTEEIDRVYLVVFPDQEVLDTILALELERSAPGSLVFAHHPANFEETGAGFSGISEDQFEELAEHQISYYACHAPLDCHEEISTVIALAKAIKLRDWEPFSPHHKGLEGVHGKVHDMSFGDFAEHLADVMDLPYLRYSQLRHNGQPVEHVALLPGGGEDVNHLELVRDLGCDTYVTGTWWPHGASEYADQQRALLRDFVPSLRMNLLGTSHYASEMLVMRDHLPAWFRNAGIEARFVKQSDPWR